MRDHTSVGEGEAQVSIAGVTAGLCTLAAVLFAPVLFGGEAFFSRDIAPFFYPMKHYLAESVRSGRVPLWNPWVVSGEPFFASLQPGLLYPGSLLLYLLRFPFAFDVLVVAHYPLAGVGMYALLRRWGHTPAGAALGGVGFMMGGFFVSLGNFPNNLQTVAWAPWLLLAWNRLITVRRLRDFLLFSATCAIAFLGGEPQMLAMILLLLLLHGLIRVETPSTGARGQVAAFGLAGLLALALVAVQLLPFAEYMLHSVRAMPIGLEYASSRSLAPRSLTHLAVPPVLTGGIHGFTTRYLTASEVPWLLSPYPGAILLVFAAAGIAAPKDRRWLAFWLAVAGAGLLLALGRYSPVFRAAFEWLPFLRPFRYPEKFYFFTAFALPVIAAQGVDRWLEWHPTGRRGFRVVVPAALLAGAYGLAIVWLVTRPGFLGESCKGWLTGALLCAEPERAGTLYVRALLPPLGVVLALLSVEGTRRLARIGPTTLSLLVLSLAAVDLTIAHRTVNPSVPDRIYREPPWAATVLRRHGADPRAYRFRGSPHSAAMGSIVTVRGAWELTNMYLDFQTMGPNVGQLFGYAMQDGAQGVELQSVALTNEAAMNAWAEDPVRFLRAMNVRYYADATVEADSMRGLRLLEANSELPIRVFEVPEPLPRAYLVSRFEIADSPESSLHRVLEKDFPLGRSVVLEQPPSAPVEETARGEIVSASYDANRVRLRVRTNGPMLLVLNDRFYPGWQAILFGSKLPMLRANGVFRAVRVPAGESEIEFRFAPLTVRLGLWISLVAAAAFLLLYRVSRRRER